MDTVLQRCTRCGPSPRLAIKTARDWRLEEDWRSVKVECKILIISCIQPFRSTSAHSDIQENGALEIHVPRPFTAERPAVSYAHQSMAMDIEEHPEAKSLPKATEGPSIQTGPQAFRAFMAPENAPETIDDFVYSDTPQLSLFITSFNNATLVSLTWPHTLMDVMGQQALLHGWSLVLAGRESEVPPVLGAREDVISAAVDAPAEKEEYHLGQKRLKGWAMAMFGLRFAGDLLRNRVVETRTIFLPAKVVAKLRLQAQGDLGALDDKAEKPFISEGDVLTAWTLRAVASALPYPRPVAALHPVNARFRLSSLAQASGVYIQNMSVAGFTFISSDVSTGPLGHIALENRRHLMEQSTEPQVLAYLREVRQEYGSGGDPSTMLYCDSDALLMPFTNWTRAKFFQTADFSPALVRAGETGQSRSNPPGTIAFHHAQSMRESATTRNIIVVLGKDHLDNYWLTATLLPPAWAKIEEELKTM